MSTWSERAEQAMRGHLSDSERTRVWALVGLDIADAIRSLAPMQRIPVPSAPSDTEDTTCGAS